MNKLPKSDRDLPKPPFFLPRLKRKILSHIWLTRIGFLSSIFILFYVLYLILGWLTGITGFAKYLNLLRDFAFSPTEKILSFKGRTNILILGKGGENHTAPDLTDTIMVSSFSGDSLVLISLPRDIWVTDLRTKLNSVYYWGNQNENDGGVSLAKTEIEKIVGIPIHYVLVIDFSSFKNIINALGGIEVEVENSFKDERYPIEGRENDPCGYKDKNFSCRFQTVHFDKGLQKMDGETALKFARSRNSEGEEGTDLARAERQQKIILGIKSKILSREVLFYPGKMVNLWNLGIDSLETDLGNTEAMILLRMGLLARNSVKNHVLPDEMLINSRNNPKYDNQYVFIPRKGDWSEIWNWVSSVLSN